jgi:hypothetical protein
MVDILSVKAWPYACAYPGKEMASSRFLIAEEDTSQTIEASQCRINPPWGVGGLKEDPLSHILDQGSMRLNPIACFTANGENMYGDLVIASTNLLT